MNAVIEYNKAPLHIRRCFRIHKKTHNSTHTVSNYKNVFLSFRHSFSITLLILFFLFYFYFFASFHFSYQTQTELAFLLSIILFFFLLLSIRYIISWAAWYVTYKVYLFVSLVLVFLVNFSKYCFCCCSFSG